MVMENKKNELDDLLKNAMQFTKEEEPEPASHIQQSLRKKVEQRKANKNVFATILRFMNTDIKLYHAGLAVTAVAVVFILLRPVAPTPTTTDNGVGGTQVADTAGNCNSLKQDSFPVKNFSTSFY
jgi:hypothetical protein